MKRGGVGRAFYQRAIMYETGLSLQAVQRKFSNLEDLEIIKKKETNARVYPVRKPRHFWRG